MSESTEVSDNALVVIGNENTSTTIGLTKDPSSSVSDTDKTDNTPRILCNELLVNPNKSKSIEKLDELSSLEREIAKMHHADEANSELDGSASSHVGNEKDQTQIENKLAPSTTVSDNSDEKNSSNEHGFGHANIEDKLDAITSGETALEHEDLIAVLKGLDNNTEETHNSGSGSILDGVTIEGEGEYQIMEVIDEDSNATEDNIKQADGNISTKEPIIHSLNKTKTFRSTALTVQEERALALEQIEGLKTVHRRRKQDIKPIKQIDSALDLVSALEADWSEHEEEISETKKLEIKTKQLCIKNKTTATTTNENKTNSPLITSVVVIPSSTASVSNTSIPSSTIPAMSNVNIIVSSNNSTNSEEQTPSKSSPTDGVINAKTEEETQAASSQSGFRRTRIIKRKIIWDPDAPETTFSYAKLVKPSNNSKAKPNPISTTAIKKGSTTITPIKKEILATSSQISTKKIQRPTTPKAKRIDLNVVKTEKASVLLKNVIEKDITKANNKKEDIKIVPSFESNSAPTRTSPPKRRSQTPVSNSPGCSAGAKKKKITEIDRLMGDEGAVNMLNSLEKLEATLGSSEVKSTRPMMRSRAATICEKLPRKDAASPTRSTATTPPTTANLQPSKGKRTTKSRASSSWDYVYKKKKQDFDDSLIIRRRSNSSYSSTTSINRLSLDGPPASIGGNNVSNSSIKRNDSTSLPATTNENDLPKRTPSTSNHIKSSGNSKTRSIPTLIAGKSFEFAKPESKKSQKRTKSPAATLTSDMKKATSVVNRRNVRSPTVNEDKSKDTMKAASTKSPTNLKDKKDTAPSNSTVSDVVVKKSSKVAQILFSTNKAKLSNTFTIQMLNKLVDILEKLASDPDCHVVVIGTNDAHFCQGIDLTDLITAAEEKRKNYAINLANSAKNYLKTLATYPKPIVGGVNGNLVNFGVIQLALFDVVIASDKTTFETPYSKIGQTPEGYCIWHKMNKIRGSFKTKLFWLCEKVQSTEAALAGLVNKLTAVNKINDDALMTAKRIASLSVESYRAMKKTIANSHLDVIVNSLDEEFSTIIKQWTSVECLENLKKYIGKD